MRRRRQDSNKETFKTRLWKNSFSFLLFILLSITTAVAIVGLIIFVWNLDKSLENWREQIIWHLIWVMVVWAFSNSLLLLGAGCIKIRSCICFVMLLILLSTIGLIVVGILVTLEGEKLEEGQLAGCPLLYDGNFTGDIIDQKHENVFDYYYINKNIITHNNNNNNTSSEESASNNSDSSETNQPNENSESSQSEPSESESMSQDSSEENSSSSSVFIFTEAECSLFKVGFKMILGGMAASVLLELILLLAGLLRWRAVGKEREYKERLATSPDDRISLLRDQLVD
eukprot:gb/GECH01012830.1/.p1 GENE.gb/GECH01012830.1/~~gb/GECH01012830.1/.p1  ORF type:complete len:286 (+),score=52.85 gb/GECH01012830.1/:1-858(+)